MTFSILERIDDVVTEPQVYRDDAVIIFQYPRTDRRCCDRNRILLHENHVVSFSILERIDDVVTGSPPHSRASAQTFSILERIDDVVTGRLLRRA